MRCVLRATLMVSSVVLAGCQSWAPVHVSTPALIADRAPSELRITLRTSEQYVLQSPVADADSIAGVFGFGRVAFSHDQVEVVEERCFSAGRTLLMLGVGVLAWGLFEGVIGGDLRRRTQTRVPERGRRRGHPRGPASRRTPPGARHSFGASTPL